MRTTFVNWKSLLNRYTHTWIHLCTIFLKQSLHSKVESRKQRKECCTNQILKSTDTTSFYLHLLKSVALTSKCGVQFVSFIYRSYLHLIFATNGDNSYSWRYLFGCTIFRESPVWWTPWGGNLLWVAKLSIAFTHGGVDQSSTQSVLFVTLCSKSGDFGSI